MATKRKTPKATKAERATFCTGWLPVPGRTLTPHAAQHWLAEKAGAYHDLLQFVTPTADKEEQQALATLSGGLGDMVKACAHATRTGKAVMLVSNIDAREEGEGCGDCADSLALVLRAVLRLPDELNVSFVQSAAFELADAIVRSTRTAVKLRSVRVDRERRRNRKPSVPELGKRMDALIDEAIKLEKRAKSRREQLLATHLKAAERLARALATAEADLEQAGRLNYEGCRIAADHFGYKDPGKPPKGYRPQEKAA